MFNLKMFLLVLIAAGISRAQFLDEFNGKKINGWFSLTGDGAATMDFIQKDGYATIAIDATKDKHNVYWTLIKRDVTSSLDLRKLKDTSNQLRVEAKVRLHDAPRRVNMMVNTQRTTNFHIDLMEYDISDTTDWHVISMTTKKFDAVPGDTVYVQLCATDYGLGKYNVDVDYYRADIVNVKLAGPDKGVLVPYHPPLAKVQSFAKHLDVAQACVINSDFPEVNFYDWHEKDQKGEVRILTLNANQWAILRWDLEEYKTMSVAGAGLLELTTQAYAHGGNYIAAYGEDFGIEFGKVRVIEILGGDPAWDQTKVTYDNLIQHRGYSEDLNYQMTYDFDVSEEPGGKNYITISNPVLQRLLSGQTKGLLLRPLGAVDVTFFASNKGSDANAPKLHVNFRNK
jgi:hypothetical protein